jgi:hypothetical protein
MRMIGAALYAIGIAAIVALADAGALDPVLRFVHAIPLGDKLGHLVLIGGLALAANVALRGRTFSVARARFFVGSAIVLAIVVAEEVSQIWLASRSFDLGDLAADVAGIALSSLLVPRLVGGEIARLSVGHE